MRRSIPSLFLLIAACGLVNGCSSGVPMDPSYEDNHSTSPNRVDFTVDGKWYSVDVLETATTVSESGRTSFSGRTSPGMGPEAFIGLSFKMVRLNNIHLSNTGDSATDDKLALVLEGQTYSPTYYECVGDQPRLRYTELGTVTVERAEERNQRIRGTFSGTIALETTRRLKCGFSDKNESSLHAINGKFDCTWMRH